MLRSQMMPVALQKLNTQPSATAQNPDVAKAVAGMAGDKAAQETQTAGFEAGITRGQRAMELASLKHSTGLESREKIAGQELAADQDIHAARLAARDRELAAQGEFHDFQLGEAKEASKKAFRIAIPAAIIEGGRALMDWKSTSDLIDKYNNEKDSLTKQIKFYQSIYDDMLGVIGKQTEAQKKAYGGSSSKEKKDSSSGAVST